MDPNMSLPITLCKLAKSNRIFELPVNKRCLIILNLFGSWMFFLSIVSQNQDTCAKLKYIEFD
jgi:hypothetical protein